MASGKKNYFRHSFNASKDPKVVGLIDDHGKEAYFHYFRLLELCANEASEGFPEDSKFTFRRSTLCRELFVTNSRLTHHLLAIQSSLLGEVVVSEKEVQILLPNLAKYMGKYETKLSSNVSNKRKEKERKEKKREEDIEVVESGIHEHPLDIKCDAIKEKKIDQIDIVVNLFNSLSEKTKMGSVKVVSSKRRDRLKKAISSIGSDLEVWENVFLTACTKGFVKSDGTSWEPDFDYIFNNENYIKFSESVVASERKKGFAELDRIKEMEKPENLIETESEKKAEKERLEEILKAKKLMGLMK